VTIAQASNSYVTTAPSIELAFGTRGMQKRYGPSLIIHWEDLAIGNAGELLSRLRGRGVITFNGTTVGGRGGQGDDEQSVREVRHERTSQCPTLVTRVTLVTLVP